MQAEKNNLAKERNSLEQILNSEIRLNNLIKKEIQQDAKIFASPRLSPLVERAEAKAISETDMTPSEPITNYLIGNGLSTLCKGT